MDSSNKLSLTFNAKIKSFEKINENFLKAKCYVMSLGKNRNKSYFSKENVDKAYSSLSFVPIVGHLMKNENGEYYLGGHDVSLAIENDKFIMKSLCVPFGVAVPSKEPVYEEVIEQDGNKVTYLVSDVILWTGRYPELKDAIYDENCYFGQSMEILFSKSETLEEDKEYSNIIDFTFDALCMLNKSDDQKFHVEPAFPSSSIVPLTYNFNKEEFSVLMNELKNELSFCMSEVNKGGKILDEKLEILNKFNKKIEDLDFSIEEFSTEELSLKMEELFGEKEAVAFSTTYNQKRDALNNALDPIVVKDADGKYIEETYFWVEDFDDSYVFVEKNYWSKTDYESTHGRFPYSFDDVKVEATINGEFEEIFLTRLTEDEKNKIEAERVDYSILEKDFELYKEKYSTANEEVESLKNYKLEKETCERKTSEDSLFSKYEEHIGNTEEFAELKKNVSNYTVDELQKECIYICGLHSFSISEEKTNLATGVKFSVEKSLESENAIDAIYKKYLDK